MVIHRERERERDIADGVTWPHRSGQGIKFQLPRRNVGTGSVAK